MNRDQAYGVGTLVERIDKSSAYDKGEIVAMDATRVRICWQNHGRPRRTWILRSALGTRWAVLPQVQDLHEENVLGGLDESQRSFLLEHKGDETVVCPECEAEQADMGRNVKCEECGYGPMPLSPMTTGYGGVEWLFDGLRKLGLVERYEDAPDTTISVLTTRGRQVHLRLEAQRNAR